MEVKRQSIPLRLLDSKLRALSSSECDGDELLEEGDHDGEGVTQGDHDAHTMSSPQKQGHCFSVRVHIVP